MNQHEYRLKSEQFNLIKDLGGKAIKWLSLCFIAWQASISVRALAGRTTPAEFAFFLLADLRANKIFSHLATSILGISGAAYGYRIRRLRHQDVERMGNRIIELEKVVDPNRSSSGLTTKGTNKSEDLT